MPGVVLVGGLGCVLGGVAGTADWPVVGTFFGAVEGAFVGAVAGLVLAGTLLSLARATRSRWATRVTSGLVSAALGLVLGLGVAGPGSSADAVRDPLAVVLLAAWIVVTGALGPAIAFGVGPMPDGRPGFTWAAGVWSVCLAWGCGLGAGVGAVTGLVIGLHYLPTAVVAAVEGAVLGSVSGLVLACLAAGIAVLPRLHPLS